MESIVDESQRLMQASLATGSRVAYKKCIERFIEFRQIFNLHACWPVEQQQIVMFIAYLSLEGRAPSSINLHISALAYVHKMNNWKDPTDSFVISKLKEGCRRLNPREDSRLPITPQILTKLISILPSICNSGYEVFLFKAAFLLAFFGFLRVGEFTAASKSADCSRILSVEDIKVGESGMSHLEVRVRYSKTDQRGTTVLLRVDSASDILLCPVNAMLQYLQARSTWRGPLFIHFNKQPLTSYQFNHMIKTAIKAIGLSPKYFSSHSFRIGAATAASVGGFSDDQIKEMGRWRSSAFQSYIRPQISLSV